MANPFDIPPSKDYGSVTGQGSRFQSGGGGGGQDYRFSSMEKKISNACSEINAQTAELKALCKQIGSKQDDPELRQRIHDLRKAAFDNVEATTELFHTFLSHYERTSDRSQKITIESLRKSFGKTANEFSQAYERIVNRLQDNPRPRVTDSMIGGPEPSDQASLLQSEEQLHIQDQLHTSYIERRAEAIENLATDMINLQEMMTSINNQVIEQGEGIDNIEAHVETAAAEVERGRSQLGAAVRYKRCSRRLTVVIALIITGVVLAIIIFLVIMVCAVGHACSKK